ncbi:MAG: VIT family protein [Candidatus Pacebacteria bacterium]|nr:VIT family protein [Candidatus Paceibacterota bacterium]
MSSQHVSTHYSETQDRDNSIKLNWLRAAVLGANDGIVSVASIIVGVAGAANSIHFILTAGIAGTVAGALSMATGEYISVSTQRDTERALLEKERKELETMPEQELEELVAIYERKGMSLETARLVALELTAHDAFAAHVDAELGIDPNNLTNPFHAAYASALAFFAGALIPILAVIFAPEHIRVVTTFISVVIALAITGALSAHTGGSSKRVAVVRVVLGGMLAMVITFSIGKIFGVIGI